jgi:hypothetical protein
VGQLLWLEKLANDGDAELLQQQLDSLSVDAVAPRLSLDIAGSPVATTGGAAEAPPPPQ